MVPQPLLSVVVPTRNRGDIIAECLAHLLAQSYFPLEIVVLDQSTDDLTRQAFDQTVAHNRQSHVTVRYIHSERIGLDAARNDGFMQTNGLWIAFCDDDVLVEENWAEAIVHEFQANPQVGMVFGQTRPYYPPEKGKRTRISVKDSPDRQVFETRWTIVGCPPGAGNNMAIARKVIERAGLFDERLGVGTDLPGGDEYEMVYRVLKHGYKVVYCPGAVAYHKRWLPEDKYLEVERGYYMGGAAALVKHCKQPDIVATLLLAVEGGGRLVEIIYYSLFKRQKENLHRAVVRASGFYTGLALGWRMFGRG